MTSTVVFNNSNINETQPLKATGCEKKIKVMAMNWTPPFGAPMVNIYVESQKDAGHRRVPLMTNISSDQDFCAPCVACGEDIIFEIQGMDPNQTTNDPACVWVEVFYETKCEPETCC